MAKFKLQPSPTFKLRVELPVPGEGWVPVEFVARYRDRVALLAFMDGARKAEAADDPDLILQMCEAWELADPFTRESLVTLTTNYPTAGRAIFDSYIDELMKVREKN